MTQFIIGGKPLTASGLHDVCDAVGVKAAEIWCVIFTETDPPYGGFWVNGRPQILYERHVFSRLTKHRYDASHPDISNPKSGNYGSSGDHQYDRLGAAASLDESAALMSASWGIGQTLGENYKEAGYASVQELVTDMFESEDKQLMAAANEMIASGCAKALRAHDWASFAYTYNGSGYAKNHYDEKLKARYAQFSTGKVPDVRVRAAQFYLLYLGYHPSITDGMWGHNTEDALQLYQTKANLPLTDQVDDVTLQHLQQEAATLLAAMPPLDIG